MIRISPLAVYPSTSWLGSLPAAEKGERGRNQAFSTAAPEFCMKMLPESDGLASQRRAAKSTRNESGR